MLMPPYVTGSCVHRRSALLAARSTASILGLTTHRVLRSRREAAGRRCRSRGRSIAGARHDFLDTLSIKPSASLLNTAYLGSTAASQRDARPTSVVYDARPPRKGVSHGEDHDHPPRRTLLYRRGYYRWRRERAIADSTARAEPAPSPRRISCLVRDGERVLRIESDPHHCIRIRRPETPTAPLRCTLNCFGVHGRPRYHAPRHCVFLIEPERMKLLSATVAGSRSPSRPGDLLLPVVARYARLDRAHTIDVVVTVTPTALLESEDHQIASAMTKSRRRQRLIADRDGDAVDPLRLRHDLDRLPTWKPPRAWVTAPLIITASRPAQRTAPPSRC